MVPCQLPSLKLWNRSRIQAEGPAVELVGELQGARWHRKIDVGEAGDHGED